MRPALVVPGQWGNFAPTVVALLGAYWIVVAILSRRAAQAEENSKARWGVWILPWLLSLDNITFGAIDGVSHGASISLSAFEQFASSAVQAGVGLAIGIGVARTRSPPCGATCGWPTVSPEAS